MRLIDADVLLDSIFKSCNTTEATINNAPTIDAVPVVRGEWVVDECDTTDDVPNFSWIDFHCSECNADYGLEEGQYGWCRYEKIPYQYCPNCGAKMVRENVNEITDYLLESYRETKPKDKKVEMREGERSCENCGDTRCANSAVAYNWDECVDSNFTKHWMPKEEEQHE